MEKMNQLKDLLKHEVLDLYSAEEQIIEALPSMIEKAKNPSLKKALREHLKITEQQKTRLDNVKKLLGGNGEDASGNGKRKGFLSGLFKSSGENKVCRAMKGLIEEGEHIMSEDMTPEVMDAAIIASAQKIEHYEISSYGTARAFARELNLGEVAELLEETLDEEYEADDKLTDLAVGGVNEEAEKGTGSSRSQRRTETAAAARTISSRSANKPLSRSSANASQNNPTRGTSLAQKSNSSASKKSNGSSNRKGNTRSAAPKAKAGSKSSSSSRSR